MKKTKLILLELYKNKMLDRSYLYLLLLFSFSLFGQDVNFAAPKTIKANFTMASVKAYQESATLKIDDTQTFAKVKAAA